MPELRTVTEIMAERAAAAGLDVDLPNEMVEAVVPFLVTQLDEMLPVLQADPHALKVVACVLHSYADVVDDYAAVLHAVPSPEGEGTAPATAGA